MNRVEVPVQRQGDWFQTVTGQVFYPLDPQPGEVHLIDIAVSLSNQCRFGGHLGKVESHPMGLDHTLVPVHYSVAQHSVLVALNVPSGLQKQALLHDAAEAYLVDVPRPVKQYLVNYAAFEARLAACISERFGVELRSWELSPEVKLADERALATEKRDLLVDGPGKWKPMAQPWLARITPWSREEACKAFLGLAARLGIR